MSEVPQLSESFLNETIAYDAARDRYALDGIDLTVLLPAINAEEHHTEKSPEQTVALSLYDDRLERYDRLARREFGIINGFRLKFVDFYLVDLSNHARHTESSSYIVLTAKIGASGKLKIKKKHHEGKEGRRLTPTEEDRQTVAEAIVQLGNIKDSLSEL